MTPSKRFLKRKSDPSLHALLIGVVASAVVVAAWSVPRFARPVVTLSGLQTHDRECDRLCARDERAQVEIFIRRVRLAANGPVAQSVGMPAAAVRPESAEPPVN